MTGGRNLNAARNSAAPDPQRNLQSIGITEKGPFESVSADEPMTGPQAYYGRVMSHGALIGIDQINEAGGVEGYPFKLIITDYKNIDVNLAVTAPLFAPSRWYQWSHAGDQVDVARASERDKGVTMTGSPDSGASLEQLSIPHRQHSMTPGDLISSQHFNLKGGNHEEQGHHIGRSIIVGVRACGRSRRGGNRRDESTLTARARGGRQRLQSAYWRSLGSEQQICRCGRACQRSHERHDRVSVTGLNAPDERQLHG